MPGVKDWQGRLKHNSLAVVCIIILIIICSIALLAYLIIPDNSQDANRQIPQIALNAPVYKQVFFIKPNGIEFGEQNPISHFLYGYREKAEYIPIDSLSLLNNRIVTSYRSQKKYHDNIDSTGIQKKTIIFWMGTDKYGRDVLSRLILGLRISLVVGFFSVLVSLTIGISLGSIGGYYGGWTDKLIMLVINTSWSIPTLLMAFAIIIALGKGFLVIVLAVGLTMWVDVARIVRGQVLQVKNELYITAARVMGFDDLRTITRHILPNIIGSILVMAAANFATAILVEAGLSYLGLGIQPPTPSLGNMLQESYAYATGGFVYLALFPILTIMTLVLCFNLLGTSLRDVFDIKSEQL